MGIGFTCPAPPVGTWRPDGSPDGVEAQCEQAFKVISKALAEAGTSLENMVRVRVFVTSREEFDRIKPIIKAHCDAARPANTTVISELVEPEMRVEIEVTAKIVRG